MKTEIIENRTTGCRGCGTYKIVFNGSAQLEYGEPGLRGVSHLLEHCMCENVKTIEAEIISNGLNWNAYTSDNEIVFYVSGLVRSLEKIVDRFTACILDYRITPEVFERERKIVLTEYNMGYSEQFDAFIHNFLRRKYNYCGAIGLKKDLEDITYEKFMAYKDRYYSKPTFFQYVRPRGSKDLALGRAPETNGIGRFNREFRLGDYDEFPAEKYSEFNSQRILLMHFSMPLGEDCVKYSYMNILKHLLTNGLTSVLYQELREKTGYVYSIYTNIDDFENDFKAYFFVMTHADKVDFIRDRMKEVLADVDKYIDRKKFRTALKTMKNALKLKNYTSYDYPLGRAAVANRENVLSGRLTYDGFLEFVGEFKNTEQLYFKDDEF